MRIKIDKGIVELQKKFLLPNNFFKNLLNEDDWSFIIKLHAFVEAACTSLLLFHLEEPNLKKIISRLELCNKSIGKLAFLKELELLGSEFRRCIVALSEIRNQLVHNVENCSISLNEMVTSFTSEQWKQFAIDFAPTEAILRKFTNSPFKIEDDFIKLESRIKSAKSSPKTFIWIGVYNLLIAIIDAEGYSEYIKFEKNKNK